MGEQVDSHADAQQDLEVRRPAVGGGEHPPDEDAVGQEENERAREPPLLGEGGENEIGVVLRQVAQPRLGAVAEALAPDLARANGDLRLDGVVAGAANVARRVDEGQDSGLLVAVEAPAPERAEGQRARQEERQEVPARQARGQRHAEPHQEDDQRAAEVGLHQGEREDAEGVGAGDERVPHGPNLDVATGEVLGEHEDERELGELDGLEADRAEPKPALGALGDRACGEEAEEERNREAVDPHHRRRAAQELGVGGGEQEEGQRRDAHPGELPPGVGARDPLAAEAGDGREPRGDEHRRGGRHRPVEAAERPTERLPEHRRAAQSQSRRPAARTARPR